MCKRGVKDIQFRQVSMIAKPRILARLPIVQAAAGSTHSARTYSSVVVSREALLSWLDQSMGGIQQGVAQDVSQKKSSRDLNVFPCYRALKLKWSDVRTSPPGGRMTVHARYTFAPLKTQLGALESLDWYMLDNSSFL